MITPQTVGWAVVALTLGAFGGHWWGYDSGHAAGALEVKGKHSQTRVAELEGVLEVVRDDRKRSAENNAAMRNAIADLQQSQRNSTKDLKNALDKSKPDRVICRFDADSMRLLNAAADAADRHAAGGIRRSVPSGGAPSR